MTDTNLLPCPFCGGEMEDRGYGAIHLDGAGCPLADLGIDPTKWNRRALTAQPVAQEPVVWMNENPVSTAFSRTAYHGWTPLYAHPAAPTPAEVDCRTCCGTGWVDDQNWSWDYPDIPQDRVPGNGLTRCMACGGDGKTDVLAPVEAGLIRQLLQQHETEMRAKGRNPLDYTSRWKQAADTLATLCDQSAPVGGEGCDQ